ncbi:hypothetical protein [Streptomyces albicerus]|uniref:hypothetical protein n=1 Tax=Streptomyces albicerus TaxID=2569859 RepID=UPI00124B5D66|nr:hypothetical protein [Streptomyces albicerus]
MSAAGEQPETEAEETEPAGEPDGMSESVARAILTLVAGLAVWGLVAVFPEIAYVIVGILCTLGWQKARRWIAQRRPEPADEPKEEALLTEAEVIRALHFLAAPNVFLSALSAELCLSVEATRAVLEELNIRIRRAVRVADTTGVGVHKDDIPPLPHPSSETPVEPVDQGQPTNQQGVTVELLGQSGRIVHPHGRPVPQEQGADEEDERQRLQDYVNRVDRAKQEAFEDHLTDALSILRGEVKGP